MKLKLTYKEQNNLICIIMSIVSLVLLMIIISDFNWIGFIVVMGFIFATIFLFITHRKGKEFSEEIECERYEVIKE